MYVDGYLVPGTLNFSDPFEQVSIGSSSEPDGDDYSEDGDEFNDTQPIGKSKMNVIRLDPERKDPRKKIVLWNPNSDFRGVGGRLLQKTKAGKLARKFVESGNRGGDSSSYSDIEFSGLSKLERDNLIMKGYLKEVEVIEANAKGDHVDPDDLAKALKVVDRVYSQRIEEQSLRSNRELRLKILSHPQDERMYSSLAVLFEFGR